MLFRAVACLCLICPTLKADPLALSDGEVMTFRVGWGIFIHAGEIAISARKETDKPEPQLRVTTTTATRGFLGGFFPFEAKGRILVRPGQRPVAAFDRGKPLQEKADPPVRWSSITRSARPPTSMISGPTAARNSTCPRATRWI
jgi:hypothetical protein